MATTNTTPTASETAKLLARRSAAAVAILLLSPFAVSSSESFPTAMQHGFGAVFSDPAAETDNTTAQNRQRLLPGQVTIEVDPDLISRTARWNVEPEESANHKLLAKIVKPLQTITEMSDGRVINGTGTAFAVGTKLLTALHNLQGPQNQHVARHYVMFEGSTVDASNAMPMHDVAQMNIPDALCGHLCNQLESFAGLQDVHPDQTVIWARLEGSEPNIMHARVIGFASLSADDDGDQQRRASSCADNLVVLVDLSFQPGSSGGPVLDLKTGKLMGVILGTLTNMELGSGIRSPGFFKPAACISDFLNP